MSSRISLDASNVKVRQEPKELKTNSRSIWLTHLLKLDLDTHRSHSQNWLGFKSPPKRTWNRLKQGKDGQRQRYSLAMPWDFSVRHQFHQPCQSPCACTNFGSSCSTHHHGVLSQSYSWAVCKILRPYGPMTLLVYLSSEWGFVKERRVYTLRRNQTIAPPRSSRASHSSTTYGSRMKHTLAKQTNMISRKYRVDHCFPGKLQNASLEQKENHRLAPTGGSRQAKLPKAASHSTLSDVDSCWFSY